MDSALQELVRAHRPHLTITEDGKVKCELNGHCFPPNLELVRGFVNGQKYKKLLAKKEAEEALPNYAPFLVPSINFPDQLFCALTNQVITRNMDAVKQHMKGRKFQKAKERFQQDKQELYEEPSLGDAMDEDASDGEGAGPGIWVPEGIETEDEDVGSEDVGSQEDGDIQLAAADGEEAAGPSRGGNEGTQEKGPKAAVGKRGGGEARAQQQGSGAGGRRRVGKQAVAAPTEAAKAAPAAQTNGAACRDKQRGRPSRAKKPRTAGMQ